MTPKPVKKEEPRPVRRTWFELVRTHAGWHVRLIGANGETVMTSEVHPERETALAVVNLCRGALPRTEFIDERGTPADEETP